MAFAYWNPNPLHADVGDCTVRAICAATGQTWEKAFAALCAQAFSMADMPSSNNVWGAYLQERGFAYHAISRPFGYTIADFCRDHPRGVYVVGTGSHVVCVKDGCYLDSWDSGNKIPIYYFAKED